MAWVAFWHGRTDQVVMYYMQAADTVNIVDVFLHPANLVPFTCILLSHLTLSTLSCHNPTNLPALIFHPSKLFNLGRTSK